MARFFQLVRRALRVQGGLMFGGLVLWPLILLLRSVLDPAGLSWTYLASVCLLWIAACAAMILATALWWLWIGTPAERQANWERRFWKFHNAEEEDPDG
jgi:hypothetical protein